MQEASDYLRDLELDENKSHSIEAIKNQWRNLCRQHHPDMGGDKEQFMRVTHAYKMLTDQSYRIQQKPRIDLTIRAKYIISFEEAVFGRTVSLPANVLDVDEQGQIITPDKLEIEMIEFKISPGSVGGLEVRAQGKGVRCKGRRGDMILTVGVNPHKMFQANGNDIMSAVEIPLDTLLRGGTVEVMTLRGIKTVPVPAGTEPGSHLRIKGCGVNDWGCHVVNVHAKFPSKEDLKTDKWNTLNINWDIKAEEEEAKRFETIFFNFGGVSSSTTTGGF